MLLLLLLMLMLVLFLMMHAKVDFVRAFLLLICSHDGLSTVDYIFTSHHIQPLQVACTCTPCESVLASVDIQF